MRTLSIAILSLVCLGSMAFGAQSLKQFRQKPNLVVLIVLDQFRSDYLTRFESEFVPAQTGNTVGGFRYLMNNGAYYPYAHYNIFQAMTCPGHAMVMSGSYPSENGISMNEWYDRKSGSNVYCVKDEEYGRSPRRLKTTTVSDELKNIDKNSLVVSLALKDRSAIMMAGQRPDQVLWMDEKKFQWETSSYYGDLPLWVTEANKGLQGLREKTYEWKALKKSIPYKDRGILNSPFGIEVSVDLALAALKANKLGQHKDQTDFLLLSLSSHDYVGHLFGPNSPEVADMTKVEDREISRLLNALQKRPGLAKTLVILTGDHGIPPSVDYAKANHLKSDRIDYLGLFKRIYAKLDAKYGAAKTGPWIEAYRYFNFYLNSKVLAEKKIEAGVLSQDIKELLREEEGVAAVYTKEDILKGVIVPGLWSEALSNQFNAGVNGDLIFMPEPFFYEKSETNVVTHMTGYNYDTRVPLIFAGAPFKSGVYGEYARVVDLASTLSFVLNVVPPPKARGRVLHESFR